MNQEKIESIIKKHLEIAFVEIMKNKTSADTDFSQENDIENAITSLSETMFKVYNQN